MPDKPINPWLRQALELGPPLLFFVAYMRFQDTSLTIGGRDYAYTVQATDTGLAAVVDGQIRQVERSIGQCVCVTCGKPEV